MSADTLQIRDLRAADHSGWLAVWQEYLAFYQVALPPEVTAHTWSRLMDPASPLKGRVAEQDGRILGFALHFTHGSTWVIGKDCYLEDLCVAKEARGQGIGRALLDDLLALGRQNGWQRVYWNTDETNTRAQALYNQYAPADGTIRYRIALSAASPAPVPP